MPAGSYQVTLKFAEIYWTAAGQRVFNASLNGSTVLSNLDIFAEVGANTADDKVFNNVQASSGLITIQLGPATVDNAKIAAIQIIPQPAASTPTLTLTRTEPAIGDPDCQPIPEPEPEPDRYSLRHRNPHALGCLCHQHSNSHADPAGLNVDLEGPCWRWRLDR